MLYTTIESHTLDGRDRSLNDKFVFPKLSSPVFISTDIDYVLRNLGVRQRAIRGYCL